MPERKIILEEQSANTGQNITFTYEVLRNKGVGVRSFLLVQKPYMERRTYATFKRQWPERSVDIVVASMPTTYDTYFDEQNPKEDILHIMVGDLQRIREYPALGYQIEQDIPADVWQAYEWMVASGYTKHLIAQ